MKTTTATQKMHATVNAMLNAYAHDHGLKVAYARRKPDTVEIGIVIS